MSQRNSQNHKKLHKKDILLIRGGINKWICKVLIHISQWQIGGKGKSYDKLVIKEMIRCYGVLKTILSLNVIHWLLTEAAGHRWSMEKLFWKNSSARRKFPAVEYLLTEITGTQPKSPANICWSSRRLKDVFKTCFEDVFNTSSA